MRYLLPASAALAVLAFAITAPGAHAQCPPKPPLAHHDSPAVAACPCFIPGEQAGAVFTAPAADYPLEVLQVNIL